MTLSPQKIRNSKPKNKATTVQKKVVCSFSSNVETHGAKPLSIKQCYDNAFLQRCKKLLNDNKSKLRFYYELEDKLFRNLFFFAINHDFQNFYDFTETGQNTH